MIASNLSKGRRVYWLGGGHERLIETKAVWKVSPSIPKKRNEPLHTELVAIVFSIKTKPPLARTGRGIIVVKNGKAWKRRSLRRCVASHLGVSLVCQGLQFGFHMLDLDDR